MLALVAACDVATAAETEEKRWSASVTLISDYRLRGVSQSWREPALQGHVQYDHPSGWYGGVWSSQVSDNIYPGAHAEVDYYAGYQDRVENGFGYDLALLHYTYPGARSQTAPGGPPERFDGTTVYLDVTWRKFGVKYWHGVSGDALDWRYADLYANFDVGDGWTFGLHAGRKFVPHDAAFEYSDWRVSLQKAIGKWMLGVAYSNTDADRELYSVADASGTQVKFLAGPAWVAWISRSF
jgi:uncharacterized protein (TIGR02001 family)